MNLPESSEEQVYQQAVRDRISVLPLALGFIVLGILLLLRNQVEGLEITLPAALLILLAAFVLTSLFRFFTSRRQERGLFFLALLGLLLGGVLALVNVLGLEVESLLWTPILLGSLGTATVLTALLARGRDAQMLRLGMLLLLGTGIALLVTQEIIPSTWVDSVVDYFPLLIAFVGVLLVPLALRRPSE